MRVLLMLVPFLLAVPVSVAQTPPAKAPSKTAAVPAPNDPAKPAALPGPGKMIHCPTTVEGAKTKLKNVPEGVELTVTAKKEEAIADIRARAAHLAEVARDATVSGKHDGQGHYGGTIGHCPVVVKDTTVSTEEIKGGAKIAVKAKETAGVKALQKEVRQRAQARKVFKEKPVGDPPM